MIGEIIRIWSLKKSRNGNSYRRVEFKMEDNSWAKTDLCPGYRNYDRWKKYIKVGTVLSGLILKEKGCVDADSFPKKVDPAPKMDNESLAKMGIFG